MIKKNGDLLGVKIKKRKQKKIFGYLALPIFLAVSLFFQGKSLASATNNIIINEVQISGGKGKTSEDYIELYNKSEKAISIGNWKLRKKTQSGAESSINVLPDTAVIPAKGYFLWSNSSIAVKVKADESTSSYIASNNSVALLDDDGGIIDQIAWGVGHSKPFVEKTSLSVVGFVADDPEVIKRKDFQDIDDNSKDFEIILSGNPKASGCLEDSKKCEIIKDKINYPVGIFLNEIYPKPNKSSNEKEFVEIFNATGGKILLDGWKIVDYGKNECLLDGKSIEDKKFLVVDDNPAEKCVLEMNDTGTETVWLKNPNDEIVSVTTYIGAKEGKSYNFNGTSWRWSKFLTPSAENIFNNQPSGTTEIDGDIFAGVYANFAVSTGDLDGDSVKVSWDFGDGHKSYLAKTRHKYEAVGTYQASVKLSDGSEDTVKNFEVKVEKFPHPKVKIVAVAANPDGADTGIESLTIENKTNKKINLNGWSIATGWKKFINHPIREDFILKKHKIKELTSIFSSFTLNNTKAEIQLRYPDGKIASKVRYKKVDGIEDGEIYQKIKGGWEWVQEISNDKLQIPNKMQNTIDNSQNSTINKQETVGSEQESENSNMQNITESGWEVEPRVVLLDLRDVNSLAEIEMLKNAEFVFAVGELREVDGRYFFTTQAEQPHYAVVFWENFTSDLNGRINKWMNYFEK